MLKDNLLQIQRDIALACQSVGRKADEVTLVAVTKFIDPSVIAQAIEAGVLHIAENRVQEAQSKFPALSGKYPQITTHIIGHLQSNKAKEAMTVASLIQSVDSLKLAQEIQKQALKLNKTVDILVQFNTAREPQKFGAAPEDAFNLMEGIAQLSQVKVKGLMAMAPLTDDQAVVQKAFADLRQLRDEIHKRFTGAIATDVLSMGMSGDFKLAIQEGSTMIRVGSALFK